MKTILIVDDDPDVVEAVSLHLRKAGHRVDAAHNRAEGMRAIETVRPDLPVLDVMMERPKGGIAMAQERRRRHWKQPIVMLTSLARATGINYGRDEEMVPVDEFVEKPVAPGMLMEQVGTLLAAAKET